MSDISTPPPPPPAPFPPYVYRSNFTRNCLLTLAAVLTGSISYYFVVVLPQASRAHLAFEERKYNEAKEEQQKKEAAAMEAEKQKTLNTMMCQTIADKAYWGYVKLNGHPMPNKADTYTAPDYVWKNARQAKQDSFEECMK